MNTTIIHPTDNSTTFLQPIYEGIINKQIFSQENTIEEVTNHVITSERCVFLGHGSPLGLFNTNGFLNKSNTTLQQLFITQPDWIPHLVKQTNNIYIWCNADLYVAKYGLKGFYTGMFISEVGEAFAMGINQYPAQQIEEWVKESNEVFAKLLGTYLTYESDTTTIYLEIRNSYGAYRYINPIAQYNWQRLYHS